MAKRRKRTVWKVEIYAEVEGKTEKEVESTLDLIIATLPDEVLLWASEIKESAEEDYD